MSAGLASPSGSLVRIDQPPARPGFEATSP
jgi:hypothetical protein